MAQTRPGQEVICDKDGHIYSYEMASMCALGGVLPRGVAQDVRSLVFQRSLR